MIWNWIFVTVAGTLSFSLLSCKKYGYWRIETYIVIIYGYNLNLSFALSMSVSETVVMSSRQLCGSYSYIRSILFLSSLSLYGNIVTMTVSLCRKYDLSQSLFYADHPLGFQYFPPRPITEGNRSIWERKMNPVQVFPVFILLLIIPYQRGRGFVLCQYWYPLKEITLGEASRMVELGFLQ